MTEPVRCFKHDIVLDPTETKIGLTRVSCPFPGCDVHGWKHTAGGEWTSAPTDGVTRRLRLACHALFDPLWGWAEGLRPSACPPGPRYKSRTVAYRWLGEFTGLPPDAAHFGLFSSAQCERVLTVLRGPPVEWPEAATFHDAMDGARDAVHCGNKGVYDLRDHPARADALPFLTFADWLDDHDDPRAAGYRVLGEIGRRPYGFADAFAHWYPMGAGPRSHDPVSDLPEVWYRALLTVHHPDPTLNETYGFCSYASLRAAREGAARAWVTLTVKEQKRVRKEIIDGA